MYLLRLKSELYFIETSPIYMKKKRCPNETTQAELQYEQQQQQQTTLKTKTKTRVMHAQSEYKSVCFGAWVWILT